MSKSLFIRNACCTRTISIVTIKLIGIKLLYKIIKVKIFIPNSDHASLALAPDGKIYGMYALLFDIKVSEPIALDNARNNRMKNNKMICLLVISSTFVRLIGAAVAFRISFDSCPVKTTIP